VGFYGISIFGFCCKTIKEKKKMKGGGGRFSERLWITLPLEFVLYFTQPLHFKIIPPYHYIL